MIATMSKTGCLTIKAENEMEQYALTKWCSYADYTDENNILIPMGSFDIEGTNHVGTKISILDEVCEDDE